MRIVLFLCLCLQIFGDDYIRSIVLVDDECKLPTYDVLPYLHGIDTSHISLPGSATPLEKELSLFLCEKENDCQYFWNDETLSRIKGKIYQYYQIEGRPLILISVPMQNSRSHVLQLVIQESKLGKVEVTGNKWLPDKRFTSYLSLKEAGPISQKHLSRDIDFINRNPYRHVDVFYSPGDAPNTTDLTLEVKDRRPYRFYTGVDNTGIPTTGRQRVFAGFSWDQVFSLDHTFLYQYTTGFNVNRFHSNTFQYTAYLPNKQILDLYGGFSIVRAKIPFPSRNNKGTNIQGSIRYHIPLFPNHFFDHELIAGFDIKNTNNTMEFVEFFAAIGQTVNMTQWILGYKFQYDKEQLVNGGIEMVFSPMVWLPNQSRSDFESLRPGADNKWLYLKAYANLFQQLPRRFAVTLNTVALWTAQVLLPSEQLGIGNFGSVRGYDERAYNADVGLVGQAELHFPTFPLFWRKSPHEDRLMFLLFLDGGGGYNNSKPPGYSWGDFLISAGPGFRYTWGPYFFARFDWGIKLHHQDIFTGGWSMFDFSCTASY
jgi:hemolysin activation/secretion protein